MLDASPPPEASTVAPVVYITDLTYDHTSPADLFDIGFLLQSKRHDLRAICLTVTQGDGKHVLQALLTTVARDVPILAGMDDLRTFLATTADAINLVVVGGYTPLADLITQDKALVRETVARIFIVGGQANDYRQGRTGERLPIAPQLKERHPEYFAADGDARVTDTVTFGRLLTSGEGIIWLPRDISLWRYAAPQMLVDGGPLTEFLRREAFAAKLLRDNETVDRFEAAEAPVVLSSLPALLLATEPDPFAWMRLFRVVPAHVEITDGGTVSDIRTQADAPNLYMVVAIDGQALSKVLTTTLRVRPLTL